MQNIFYPQLRRDAFQALFRRSTVITSYSIHYTKLYDLIAYRALAPAEPAGVTGFDIGVAASFVKIDSGLWDLAMDSATTDFAGEDYP